VFSLDILSHRMSAKPDFVRVAIAGSPHNLLHDQRQLGGVGQRGRAGGERAGHGDRVITGRRPTAAATAAPASASGPSDC